MIKRDRNCGPSARLFKNAIQLIGDSRRPRKSEAVNPRENPIYSGTSVEPAPKITMDVLKVNICIPRLESMRSGLVGRKSPCIDSSSYDSSSEESRLDVSETTEQWPIDSYSGCRSCETESKKLYKSNSQNQFQKSLPDYSHLDYLSFRSDPGFIDCHCHLDFLFTREHYNGSYANYMRNHKESYPATYDGCVAVFCNPLTFPKRFLWLKYLNENGVWGAFGCHPHKAEFYSDVLETALGTALQHSKVRALGEIGLDYSNRNACPKETQHKVLKRQLKIAVHRRLPLVIHCRDANEDLMTIMKELVPRDWKIHLHCFTDSWNWAQKWFKEYPNLYIGITNLVTYNSAKPTHEVVQKMPLSRLLLETDAPYFIPRLAPKDTKCSHPGMAIHVAAQISTLRSITLRELLFATRHNTYVMYGI